MHFQRKKFENVDALLLMFRDTKSIPETFEVIDWLTREQFSALLSEWLVSPDYDRFGKHLTYTLISFVNYNYPVKSLGLPQV